MLHVTPIASDLPPFRAIADLIREHAAEHPQQPALGDDATCLDFAALDQAMNRVAAALQRDGLEPGDVVALCATPCVAQAVVFLGALRAGAVVAPLAPSVTPEQLSMMLSDCGARLGFFDATARALLPQDISLRLVHLEGALLHAPADVAQRQAPEPAVASNPDAADAAADNCDGLTLQAWLAPPDARPQPVSVRPEDPFNIIYSSGTTGVPKGIVQPHGMRWAHVMRARRYGYGAGSVTLLATPLYSNTTLVAFFPALASGGQVQLMSRFDALGYLERAQRLRATHTMLVPVQVQRLLDHPRFGDFDLSAFQMKLCTSAPFGAALKAQVLQRWPGALVEVYGLTEGGGTCMLEAHLHPHKLHTVGRPVPGHDIRLIDEQGTELPAGPGVLGEVVGRSPGMMTGYHRQPDKTREAEWFDAQGQRFIRTGDVGRFDEDGFLTLMDRRKDMIISGGFNVYPSDLEAVLRQHPQVAEAAVAGVPSPAWGETPVAWVVPVEGATLQPEELRAWCNARVGKTQRLHALRLVPELPRSAIGKVLKRELQQRYALENAAPGVEPASAPGVASGVSPKADPDA